jgi:hypothetical protein
MAKATATNETVATVDAPATEKTPDFEMIFSDTREAAETVPHHPKSKLYSIGVPSGKKDKATGKDVLTNLRYAWSLSTGQLREGYARKVLSVVNECLSERANRTPADPKDRAKKAIEALPEAERKEILKSLGLL